MINLHEMAANLEPGVDGIWVARARKEEISYPDEGNSNCLALESDSFWFRHRNRCIQALLRKYPPPGVVFDVGGGNGYVAHGLQQAGVAVALVEPGRQGIENARRRGVETLVCSTLEEAGFRPGSVPAVGLFDVLEHIAADGEYLKMVQSLLVPGGRLYLTLPAFQALWSADDDYAGHHRRYAVPGLKKIVEQAGLQVEFASYFFFLLPLPIFLARVVPTRLGLRKQEAWDSYQQEHQSRTGLAGRLLDGLLGWELRRLRSGKSMPVGGSCLLVARREP
jgi:SAM-dependent methyltransferase